MIQMPKRELSLTRLISPERILSRLPGNARHQVTRALVGAAACDLGLEAKTILTTLAHQPGQPTFGPARGVAMLHVGVDVPRRPAAFLARLKEPIAFGAADGEFVQIVTLVLAPTDEPSTLLRAMACVARRLRSRSVREAIRTAHDAVAIFSILVEERWPAAASDFHDKEDRRAKLCRLS
ncbi:PTS sugar transporter subunit IIA [Methylobacterium radiodurans]|uniref:PTS EIIA type-2 domain-containing protein n=1 Tax=Methylobacterium radiodurans TaxID=2202828 RepID=A0A2U8VNB6_9HYPH|nr:PTS sugar transporter subunit IIA [Methylobacterium radiodurans]AWN35114.1 hypothetical protein DK427_04610 [Methylobacterium radiodurans]